MRASDELGGYGCDGSGFGTQDFTHQGDTQVCYAFTRKSSRKMHGTGSAFPSCALWSKGLNGPIRAPTNNFIIYFSSKRQCRFDHEIKEQRDDTFCEPKASDRGHVVPAPSQPFSQPEAPPYQDDECRDDPLQPG